MEYLRTEGKGVFDDECIKESANGQVAVKLTEELHEKIDIAERNDEVGAPDGGWGWFVVIGAVILHCFTSGIVRSNGILYGKFQDKFHGSATSTALILSLAYSVRLVVGPFVSILTKGYSCRCLTAIGAVIFCFGLIISAYTPTQYLLYVSFSCLCGIGRAFTITPVPILLGQYFDKRRSLAFGFANAGVSIGGFVISPFVEVLFQSYGYHGALLILGGFALQVLVSSALFRPINLHRQFTVKYRKLTSVERLVESASEQDYQRVSESDDVIDDDDDDDDGDDDDDDADDSGQRKFLLKRNSIGQHKYNENNNKASLCVDLSILKDARFLSFVIATVCFMVPNITMFLPSIAKENGLPVEEAVFLLSVFYGSNGLFSVLSGLVFDCNGIRDIRPQVYMAITFCQSVTIVVFPWMTTFRNFCLVSALNGALIGVKSAQRSVILMDMLGMEKFASSQAIAMSAQAFAAFLGPTVSGRLVDIYGSFDGAFYLAAGALFLGGVILTLGQIYQSCVVNKNQRVGYNRLSSSDTNSKDISST